MAACLYRQFRCTMVGLIKNRTLIMNCTSDKNKLLSTPLWLVSLNSGRFKGHSHWQNIKTTKQKADKAFARIVSFYARKINQSVRDHGADTKKNRYLDQIMLDAMKENVPLQTLQKLVQAAATKPSETYYLEMKGPADSCIIVACTAGSKSHALANAKYRIKKGVAFPYETFIYNDPTVRSYFTHIGVVWIRKDSTPLNPTVESKKTWSAAPSKEIPPPLSLDDAENLAIELNAESVTAIIDDEDKEAFEIICDPTHVDRNEAELSKRNYIVRKAETEFRPICRVKLNEQNKQIINQLYEILNTVEEIDNIYDNVEFDEE